VSSSHADLGPFEFFDQVKVKYFNGNLPSDTFGTLKLKKTNHSIGTRDNTFGFIDRSNNESVEWAASKLSRYLNLSELWTIAKTID